MNDKILFEQVTEKMRSIKDPYFNSLKEDLLNGHNSYLRFKMQGSSFFNNEWIARIEDCIYELGQIVNNPKEVTTTEGHVTPIELAKKIDGESVQHLASHSQFVKEVDEKGNVIPVYHNCIILARKPHFTYTFPEDKCGVNDHEKAFNAA